MEVSWNITDFAELQIKYTGAINKRKWIITNPQVLESYFTRCEFQPKVLKNKLNCSYATLKRFLISANLWHLAIIRTQNSKGGRKRTAIADKFGYPFADSKHDIVTSTGDVKRRSAHHVVAEQKYNRPLQEKEVVHHINLLKFDNNLSNITICRDNSHHRKLHSQLETVAGELVRLGIIKFDEDRGYYHTLYEVDITNE